LLAGLIWNVRFHNTVMGALVPGWDFGTWLRIQWVSLLLTIAGVLWYVPIAGYLLLVSAWARGKVFLWAVLPWIALMIAEQFVHTGAEVAKFLGRRFTGFVQVMGLPNQHTSAGRDFDFDSVDAAFSHFNIWGVLGHYETWVGVAAGAALIALAIRIRRFRDDS
jgi:ABC-2 type transport system permease protein